MYLNCQPISDIRQNIIIYYKHFNKAIVNKEKLGFFSYLTVLDLFYIINHTNA